MISFVSGKKSWPILVGSIILPFVAQAEGLNPLNGVSSLKDFVEDSIELSVDDQVVNPPGVEWGASFDEVLSYICSIPSVESINIKGLGPTEKDGACRLTENKLRELSDGQFLGPLGFPEEYEGKKIYTGQAEVTAYPVKIDGVPYKASYNLSTRFKLDPIGVYLMQSKPEGEYFVAHALNKVDISSADSGLVRGQEGSIINSFKERYGSKKGFNDKGLKRGVVYVKHGGVKLKIVAKNGEVSLKFDAKSYLKEKIEVSRR